MRHENDVTSELKCKFYKHLGSPNLATIVKFDEVVKIGCCTQLVNGTSKTFAKKMAAPLPQMMRNCLKAASPKGGLFRHHMKTQENSFHNARIRFSVRHIGWGKIESLLLLLLGKCRHHLISQDLFWIKVVIWNYLQTDSVTILAILCAVFVNSISIEITI